MPSKVIKGPDAEDVWAKAQEKAAEQYGNLKVSDPDKYYAIVMTIYKSMCTKHNCTPKKESVEESMGEMLGRLELTEAAMPKLKVPKSAGEWDLYTYDRTPEQKKRNTAAKKALNAGLRAAAKDIWGVMKKTPGYSERTLGGALSKAWSKHVAPVMSEYSDTGASDTEPRYVAAQALIDFIKDHYDVDWFTGLGDYV